MKKVVLMVILIILFVLFTAQKCDITKLPWGQSTPNSGLPNPTASRGIQIEPFGKIFVFNELKEGRRYNFGVILRNYDKEDIQGTVTITDELSASQVGGIDDELSTSFYLEGLGEHFSENIKLEDINQEEYFGNENEFYYRLGDGLEGGVTANFYATVKYNHVLNAFSQVCLPLKSIKESSCAQVQRLDFKPIINTKTREQLDVGNSYRAPISVQNAVLTFTAVQGGAVEAILSLKLDNVGGGSADITHFAVDLAGKEMKCNPRLPSFTEEQTYLKTKLIDVECEWDVTSPEATREGLTYVTIPFSLEAGYEYELRSNVRSLRIMPEEE
ncbi:MAG: hypothetical protein AABW49_03005 [Nanoarchaeota archaeon]